MRALAAILLVRDLVGDRSLLGSFRAREWMELAQRIGLMVMVGGYLAILDAPAAPAAATNQCPQTDAAIATDRPDVTNSSLVVPRGSLQSENGINVSAQDGG